MLGGLALLAWGCSAGDAVDELPDCTARVTRADVAFSNVDAVDVLFVIDDSPSMKEEQETLRQQLPAMMTRLVTGLRTDGEQFDPLRDLRVGVISSDLGATGLEAAAPGCGEQPGGDAAQLLHEPIGEGCGDSYPTFLSVWSERPTAHPLLEPALLDATGPANDLLCIGGLGIGGCSYSQPLEAALRAPEAFLRSDPEAGLSLVVIVVITDKDDCSTEGPGVFDEARGTDEPEAHCASHSESLFAIERYVTGLKALRPDNEQLVMFAAIAGVPTEATNDGARETLAFDDVQSRDAFYDALLAHPLMQTTVERDGTLRPGCDTVQARATPSNRLVEVAREFGANGTVRSICADDWTKIFDDLGLQGGQSEQEEGVCLPRALPRDDQGLVPCTVTWELPAPDSALPGTPVDCDERPSLSPHPEHPVSDDGGAVCVVRQLAISGLAEAPELASNAGWFYDDFSRQRRCADDTQPAVFFAPSLPPTGVKVAIECVDERLEDGGPGSCGEP